LLKAERVLVSFYDSKAQEQRHTHSFEMIGNRAVYDKGWVAAARHGRMPWDIADTGGYDFDKDKWELYNVADDFSEANDVATAEPQKLHDLQDLFWVEAAKYNVLPLDDRSFERADPSLRPSLIEGRTDFTYYPGAIRIPESSAANVKNRSHTITAYIDLPQTGADGVLVAAGGVVAGYALYVEAASPSTNTTGFPRNKVTSSEKLSPGPATIRVQFQI
jgi:hypothetical protein